MNWLAWARDYLLYGGIDREAFEGVKPKIERGNRVNALVFGSVGALLIGIMLVVSLFASGFASSRPIYLAGIALSLIIVCVAYLAKRWPSLSYVAIYMAVAVFLGYGIAIATLSRPDQQTVTFMVLMIFVPLIFIDRPLRMAASLVLAIGIFIVLAQRTKTGSVLSVDVTDALIFGFLAIAGETVVNSAKIRGYALENQLHTMSETDQLTGLNNRNCYERKVQEYAEAPSGMCCIYIDVNGLHELNNTQGHKAGDEMLIYVANAVRKQFGREHSFRIGGDEFVAFTQGKSEAVVAAEMAVLEAKIEAAGYHAAMGMAGAGDGAGSDSGDFAAVISAAEAAMYESKAAYYSTHDRRRR